MLTVEQIKDEASYCGFIGSVDQLVIFVRRIEAVLAVPPELFAQQIAAAMRFADAPLSETQAVTLVLYLKARAS